MPNRFQAWALLDWAKFSVGSCTSVKRQHHEPKNLFLTIWHHPWHERSKRDSQPGAALCCSGNGMTGVDVGAVCAVWHMRTESRVYQAGLPRPKLGGRFQHMAERDPREELFGALQSERDLQVALPCTGVSTTATRTIFSRKLLMNLGFPPLTRWELHLTSVEASLGITPYSLKKKIVPFSANAYKFQPFLELLLFASCKQGCAASSSALFASPASKWQGVAAALDVLKKAHTAGMRPSSIISDELIISLTCLARLSANTL